MEDKLVCRIKENPEPVVFPLCCQGVKVELRVSPKRVHFNRLLLHRSVIPRPLCWGRVLSVSSPSASLAGCMALQAGCWAGVPLSASSSRSLAHRSLLAWFSQDSRKLCSPPATWCNGHLDSFVSRLLVRRAVQLLLLMSLLLDTPLAPSPSPGPHL